jgi:Asp-tRNA(Asn)/Glu-tRNA(Gln) amidotransferase A subunit family amidase
MALQAAQITAHADHAGLPQITLPLPVRLCGCLVGLPVGLSILRAAGDDEALLAFAASVGSIFHDATN